MTQSETKVEQQINKLCENRSEIKFEDLHVLFSERKQEILPLILSKYGLNEERVVCPECHAVARKIRKGVLVCNCEDKEIVLNKRGKYLPEKHMRQRTSIL